MRQLLLALSLATSTLAVAQDHDHNHNYDRSVFTGVEAVRGINTEYLKHTTSVVKSNFPGWAVDIDKLSGLFSDMYGAPTAIAGNAFADKAENVMDIYLKDLGINKAEWKTVRDADATKAHYVDFEQQFNGHKVVFSRLSFRFTKDGKLVRVKNRSYGNPGVASAPSITRQQLLQSNLLTADINGAAIAKTEVENDWVWFPVPAANGYSLRPAWEVTVVGAVGEGAPLHLNGFIDAVTGEILYRTDEIKTIDVTIKGIVNKTNIVSPATLEPLANLEVNIGGNVLYTNDTGYVSDPSAGSDVAMSLKGKWSRVVHIPTNTTPTDTIFNLTSTGSTDTFDVQAPFADRHVNAYYHVNTVHDFMKMHYPSFTGMDIQLPTNIDLTGGTCNAFYNSTSINFYAAGGNCKSFATIADVVYHEYGHGINRTFYAANGANSMRNGALNEGHADVWAMGITKDSLLARDYAAPGSTIRRYDGANYKVYPKDIKGEVHADGEIIAGAWYDVANNIGSFDTMSNIFAQSFYDVSDGPNGMEGAVYHDVLIAAIFGDDDDNDVSNGTPHFEEIVRAFAKHGIYLYADAKLKHQELAHQPANTPITVNAGLDITNPMFFQSLKLIYKERKASAWDTLTMTDNGNYNFTTIIPSQPQGSILDYYFRVYDLLDMPTVSYPANYTPDVAQASQVTIPYQFAVGISPRIQITFEDSLSSDWKFSETNDNATASGRWVQAVPTATYYRPNNGAFGNYIAQTGKDHTSGSGKCLVTGNLAGTGVNTSDVDSGRTTMVTPAFDLSGYVYPIVEYYRWFVNDYGDNRRNDPWRVEIKLSTSTLATTVDYTFQSDTNWRRRIFAVDQFLKGAKTNVQLRFTASDNIVSNLDYAGQSTVEAAVDDFFIYDGVPTGVATVEPVKASIHPNPADGYVTVKLPAEATGSISVYDITGKIISTVALTKGVDQYQINTRDLIAGHYMLIIQTGKSIQSHKLVVSHH